MNNNDGRDSFLISNFDPSRPFKPKRALVLGKLSRYEFEKHRNPNIDEKQLMTNVNYSLLVNYLFHVSFYFRSKIMVPIISLFFIIIEFMSKTSSIL